MSKSQDKESQNLQENVLGPSQHRCFHSNFNKDEVSRLEGLLNCDSGYLKFDSSNAIAKLVPSIHESSKTKLSPKKPSLGRNFGEHQIIRGNLKDL